jgi:hypothetical protein
VLSRKVSQQALFYGITCLSLDNKLSKFRNIPGETLFLPLEWILKQRTECDIERIDFNKLKDYILSNLKEIKKRAQNSK